MEELEAQLRQVEELYRSDYTVKAVRLLNACRQQHAALVEEQCSQRPTLQLVKAVSDEIDDLLRLMDGSSEWTTSHERDGTRTCTYHDPETNTTKFRVEGTLRADLLSVAACFYETDLIYQWIPGATSSRRLHEDNMFTMICYLTMSFPYLMISRDLLARGYGDTMEDGSLMVFLKSTDKLPAGVEDPPVHGVRLGLQGVFRVREEEIGGNVCKMECIFDVDFKLGLVPRWMIDTITKNFCGYIISFIGRHAKKFQDEGVHAERLELNAAVYAKIRERISDARESARMLAEEGKVDTS